MNDITIKEKIEDAKKYINNKKKLIKMRYITLILLAVGTISNNEYRELIVMIDS